MRIARWIVPAVVALALIAVAVVELVRQAQLPRPSPVRVLDEARVLFEPRDRVIDLRQGVGIAGDVVIEPIHELEEGWGEATESGSWSTGNRSAIALRLASGGQRALFIEARLDDVRGPPLRLRVTVNGVEGGLVRLRRTLHVERLVLPEGLLGAGANRLEFELVRRGDPREPASGRSLLLSRLVLAEPVDADFRGIVVRRPVVLDRGQEMVTIRAPGRLVLRFDVPYAGSFLGFRYRCRAGSDDTDFLVGVGRWFSNLAAADTMATVALAADQSGFRDRLFFMGHHVGQSVLWFDVGPHAAEAILVIRDLRLTPEPQS